MLCGAWIEWLKDPGSQKKSGVGHNSAQSKTIDRPKLNSSMTKDLSITCDPKCASQLLQWSWQEMLTRPLTYQPGWKDSDIKSISND